MTLDSDLKEWARQQPILALKAMAGEKMPHVHGAGKWRVVSWLMENDPDILQESRDIMRKAREVEIPAKHRLSPPEFDLRSTNSRGL